MEPSVINTKIHFPILQPKHIKRSRIEDRLNRDLISGSNFTRKVTLISAPAGYGKTSLAASWMQDIPTEKCWLSIDENDNDPVRFLTYLLKAIQTAAPGTGKTSEAILRSPNLPPAESILGPLINELSELKYPLIISLDDYHIIQQIEIHKLMDFFIQHMHPMVHIVIISREDPPFPLHNLRAKNQMEEIRQVDLAFTEVESANFLCEAYSGEISEDDLRFINQRTEGWVTGLQLTALSLKNHPNPQEMLKNIGASTRFILDYLFQEIFQVQTEKNKDFLLKASILEQISPELGNAISGYTDSESILQEFTQSNLFIKPIEESGSWFRFHRLFLELLRQRLRAQKVISIETLHLKASKWYEDDGSMDESIHHAIEGEHWKRAAGLISHYSDFLLKNGRITTLLIWLNKIPNDIIGQTADHCLTFAWPLLLSGNLEEAEIFINKAKIAARQNAEVSGQISAARAYLAQAKGNGTEMVRHSEEALSLLAEDDFNNRGVIALNLGIAYWHAGEMEQAEIPLREAIPAAQKSSNPYAETSAQLFLARIAAVQGRLIKAAEATREICVKRTGIPIEDLALTDMAIFHYEWNEISEAITYIDKAIHSLQQGSVTEFTLAGYMIKIRIMMSQRKLQEVNQLKEKCLSLISESKPSERIFSRWSALNVELALSNGNTSEARSWMEKITVETDAYPFYRFMNLAPIRIQIAEKNTVKAKELLIDSYANAKRKGWNYLMVWLLTRMALCDGKEKQAVEHLNEALHIGHTGNMVRTFVDAGPKLLPHLCNTATSFPHPTFIGNITNAIKKESKFAFPANKKNTLSERENEILHLIAAGLTNKQIAEQLVISISTVKSHVNHICTKLNAANRTQAASLARSLGIIE